MPDVRAVYFDAERGPVLVGKVSQRRGELSFRTEPWIRVDGLTFDELRALSYGERAMRDACYRRHSPELLEAFRIEPIGADAPS